MNIPCRYETSQENAAYAPMPAEQTSLTQTHTYNFKKVWHATAETALAGLVLGAVLGTLAVATFMAGVVITFTLATLSLEGVNVGAGIVAEVRFILFMLFAGLGLGFGVGGTLGACVGGISSFFTFSILTIWIPDNHWPTIIRSYHRGMLYGSVFGVALFLPACFFSLSPEYFAADTAILSPSIP